MTLHIPRGSVEYVTATVTADVSLDMPVEISVSRGGVHAWLPAVWEGTPGMVRNARTINAVTFDSTTYAARNYDVCVRLSDNPEVPIVNAGSLHIS